MNTAPQISVILPFYNAKATLKAAAQSILNQSFCDFELLLIDNNSTDNSKQVAQELAAADSRVCLLNETQQGVAHAMNRGLINARGKFIARMDADDISYRNRLEHQLQFLKANSEIGCVGSEVEYITHSKNTDGFKRFIQWVNSFHTPSEIEKNRFVEIPIVNPTIFFRRELYEQYGGCLHGNFPEDYEMQLRYLDAGVKMAKIAKPLLEWHDYSSRLTRTDERYSSNAFFKTKAKYFKSWSEQNNPFHPDIWIWGAGRKTRQRSAFLEKQGLQIKGRIDIVKTKTGTTFYRNIPTPGEIFVVSMVSNTGAGKQIREFLESRMYREEKDFILMG